MADYFVILKRAVSGLSDQDREKRQAIYDKARKALLSQLQNMDPPLAPPEITKQRLALEEAIRSVERDLGLNRAAQFEVPVESAAPSVDHAPAQPDPSRPDQAAPSPSVAAAPVVSVGPDEGKADETTVPASAAAPAEEKSPPVESEPAARSQPVVASKGDESRVTIEPPSSSSASDRLVRRAGQDVLKNAVRDANALGTATSAAVKSAQTTADMVGEQRAGGEAARIEPTLGDALVSDSKSYQRTQSDEKAEGDRTDSKSFGSEVDDDGPSSNFWMIVGFLLLVGLLAGSGYLLYQNKDAFLTDNFSNPAAQLEDTQTAGDGQDAIPAKTVRTVTVTPGAGTDSGKDAGDGAQTTGQDDQTGAGDADNADNDTGKADNAQGTADAGNSAVDVAERSILYEEGKEGVSEGRATGGDVMWSLEGAGEDAVIKIDANIPDRGVHYHIKISKNDDAELPASHLIEISFKLDENDEGQMVSEIPGLIFKPTEQSRGQGLVGAAIRISDDLFWIALTKGEREIKYNIELMQLRSWIDIPILYKSGVRAILTLEKGDSGDDVVTRALTAWGQLP